MKDGFVKTAAGTPDIKVADCGYNCARIKALIDKAHEQGVRVLVLRAVHYRLHLSGSVFSADPA